MGCASSLAGCLLVFLNAIFLLIAIAIGGVGGVIKWGTSTILEKPLMTVIPTVAKDKVSAQDVKDFITEFFSYLGNYGIILFIVGVVMVIVTMLAILGVCCESKCFLGTYAFIVFIFLGGIAALTVLAYIKKEVVQDFGAENLKKFVKDKYKLPNNTSNMFKGISGIINMIQIKLECCGVNNYTDFNLEKDWKDKIFYFTANDHTIAVTNLTSPPSCCNFTDGLNSLKDDQCMTKPTTSNSYIASGCYTKLWQKIDDSWDYVKYTLIGVTAFLLILFISALCAMRFEKEKIEPI